MERMRLIDVFGVDITKGGIFTKLNTMFNLPFKDLVEDWKVLDFDFITKYGQRKINNLIQTILDGRYSLIKDSGNTYVLETRPQYVTFNQTYSVDEMLSILAVIIWQRFRTSWDRVYATMIAKYNPIENYSMVEHEETNTKIVNDVTNSASSTNTIDNDNSTYGFNSSNPVPTDKGHSVEDGTSYNSGTSTTTGSADDNNRTLTRSGNIGVTTSAQMIEQERKLWKYDFIDSLFDDVAKLISLKIY